MWMVSRNHHCYFVIERKEPRAVEQGFGASSSNVDVSKRRPKPARVVSVAEYY